MVSWRNQGRGRAKGRRRRSCCRARLQSSGWCRRRSLCRSRRRDRPYGGSLFRCGLRIESRRVRWNGRRKRARLANAASPETSPPTGLERSGTPSCRRKVDVIRLLRITSAEPQSDRIHFDCTRTISKIETHRKRYGRQTSKKTPPVGNKRDNRRTAGQQNHHHHHRGKGKGSNGRTTRVVGQRAKTHHQQTNPGSNSSTSDLQPNCQRQQNRERKNIRDQSTCTQKPQQDKRQLNRAKFENYAPNLVIADSEKQSTTHHLTLKLNCHTVL